MIMRLIGISQGRIVFDGQDIGAIPAKKFAKLPLRKRIQMVFQDPTDSLNPRFTAARAIADPDPKARRSLGWAGVVGRAARSLQLRWGCQWSSLTAFPTISRAGRRRALVSRGRLR